MAWNFHLSREARADVKNILKLTLKDFGPQARLRYNELIYQALDDIAENPDRIGSQKQRLRGKDFLTYHLKHSKEKARTDKGIVKQPRHIIFYLKKEGKTLKIVRILHERRDFSRHISDELDSL